MFSKKYKVEIAQKLKRENSVLEICVPSAQCSKVSCCFSDEEVASQPGDISAKVLADLHSSILYLKTGMNF